PDSFSMGNMGSLFFKSTLKGSYLTPIKKLANNILLHKEVSMPLYEYRCESCQKTLEVIQKFSDSPLTQCPDCGKSLEKLMSLGSFQLKGSGWYNTDYKKSSTPSSSAATESCSGSPSTCSKPACSTT
ncbi:MAG: FmdB family zinc ribbon protein, partial [Deltaproteobacteria bacterium]